MLVIEYGLCTCDREGCVGTHADERVIATIIASTENDEVIVEADLVIDEPES